MRRFFLWLGGADPEVLDRAPSTAGTTAALGGTVLTTAVMATVAFTMATHDWLGVPPLAAAIVGCAWGLAILNLDRWLLLATRRQATTQRTIALAIPRVLLAVVMAFVIAEPLVLRVFESDVTLQAKSDRQAEKTTREKRLDKQYADISKLEVSQANLQRTIAQGTAFALSGNADYDAAKATYDDAQEKLAKAERAVGCEAQGTCGTGRSGCGPVCAANRRVAEQRRRAADKAERELNAVTAQLRQSSVTSGRQSRAFATPELDRVNTKLAERRVARDKQLEEIKRDYNEPLGAIDRMEALHHLADKNTTVAWSTWLFRLFLIAIDITPILFKTLLLIGKKSPSELAQEQIEEHEFNRLELTEKAEDEAHSINAQLIVEEAQIQADLRRPALREMQEEIAEVEKEVWRQQIEDWRDAVRATSGGPAAPNNHGGAGMNGSRATGSTPPPATPAGKGKLPVNPTPSAANGGGAAARPQAATVGTFMRRAVSKLRSFSSTLRRPATTTTL